MGAGRGYSCRDDRTPSAPAKALGIPYATWMKALRNQNVHNAALSAIDYQTGEIIAYVGSANYYETRKVNPQLQPQFDVLANGWRQPGSAFKPFNYVTGINDRTMTASSLIMDVEHQLRQLHAQRCRQSRTRAGAAAQGTPVLAEHPGCQDARPERDPARLRQREGVRPDLPEQRPADAPGCR